MPNMCYCLCLLIACFVGLTFAKEASCVSGERGATCSNLVLQKVPTNGVASILQLQASHAVVGKRPESDVQSSTVAALRSEADEALHSISIQERLLEKAKAQSPRNEVDLFFTVASLLAEVTDDTPIALPQTGGTKKLPDSSLPSTHRQNASCSPDTGATCIFQDCPGWRAATCLGNSMEKRCMCSPGECAIAGRCIVKLPPPSDAPKKVAVVGCGIAGALTVMELAHRGIQVDVFEREADCGVGTSGRIAAEMMFYSYHKEIFKQSIYGNVIGALEMLKGMQFGATPPGMFQGLKWKQEGSKVKGKQVTVEVSEYQAGNLKFTAGASSPIVRESHAFPTIEPGMKLEYVGDLPAYAIHHINIANNTDEMLQEFLVHAEKPITLKFVVGEDERTNQVFEAAFFEAAGHRLRDFFLVEFPELCEAVVTPFCCEIGTRARAWVEANPDKAGYRCPADPFAAAKTSHGMGCAHAFVTEAPLLHYNPWGESKRITNHEDFDFEIWNASHTNRLLSNWLNGQTMAWAAVNRNASGFVRTELVFKIIQDILAKKNCTFHYNREITDIQPILGGVAVSTRHASGSWSDVDNVRTFTPSQDIGTVQKHTYDRLVVATGGAVNDALEKLDPELTHGNQLLPVNGFIVLGPEGQIPVEDRDIGVIFEEYHMYLRATRNGNAAIGGGMFFDALSDDDVRALRYQEGVIPGFQFDAKHYMSQHKFGEDVVNNPKTLKLGGVRPMSYLGNFPLIKSYQGGRVVLNTGGGANGFVTSWKAGQLAAEIAIEGAPADTIWHLGYTEV